MSEVEKQEHLNNEDINKAMNLVGQNLYGALGQSLQQLPENMRNKEIILHGISGFLANIMHQQAPNEAAASRELLEKVYKLADAHLGSITP